MIWFALAILVFASAGLVFYQVATPLWLNRFQKQSAALIDTPNGAAALLLVAVAEVRGPISILERSIIERQLTSTLSLHADATAHLVDEAIEDGREHRLSGLHDVREGGRTKAHREDRAEVADRVQEGNHLP